ncbi:hypothetical protein L9F63_025238, partial [Diploptera punctata]
IISMKHSVVTACQILIKKLQKQGIFKTEFWLCPRCNFKNSMTLNSCASCRKIRTTTHVPKPNTKVPVPVPIKPIEKITTSKISSEPVSVHREIRKSITSQEVNLRKKQKNWHCSRCMYENVYNAEQCVVCNRYRTVATRTKMKKNRKALIRASATNRRQSQLIDVLRQIEEKEAIKDLELVLEHCRTENKLYVDDSFPPTSKSLYYDPNKPNQRIVQWLRPQEIRLRTQLDINWTVFRTMLPTDISQALESGRTLEGMSILTGAPCESLHLTPKENEEFDIDLTWTKLLSYHSSGFLMGISCGKREATEQQYEDIGLQLHHAYSILDVKDVHGLHMMRLRNPWGCSSWKGDWSDSSPKWTEELKNELLPHESSSGIFWICFDDVLKYFDCVDICKIRPEWNEVRLLGSLPTYALNEQLNSVFRVSSYPVTKLGSLVQISKCEVRSAISLNCMLEAGSYAVIYTAFNHWNRSLPHDPISVLAVHSSKSSFIEQISIPNCVLGDAIINIVISKGRKESIDQYIVQYTLSSDWAGLIIIIENRNSTKWVQAKVDCRKNNNIVSTRDNLITADSIPPMHRQVVVVLSQLDGSQSFSRSYMLELRFRGFPDLYDWGRGSHYPPIDKRLEGLHIPRIIG